MFQQVFRRTEVKYILSQKQYRDLMSIIEPYLKKDKYFRGTNCSVYFDTAKRYLAIHSVESPLYKEKVRLRSYGTPNLDDIVFLEIKKKFKGVGSKRRVPVALKNFYKFMDDPDFDFAPEHPQIQAELKYIFRFYNLEPALFLAYDRTSYCDENDPTFRVTFDERIRSRTKDLRLEDGDRGKKYFKNKEVVMEVKALDAYPFWFVRALSRLQIYPAKFSKYGRVMKELI